MSVEHEVQKMLAKAKDDELVLNKLIDDLQISDEIWGFHAQQAVEKLLKALLFKKCIEFPRTHDLGFLASLLVDAGLKLPVSVDEIEFLEPFGVALRYDSMDMDIENMDRNQTRETVVKIRQWVEQEVGK